MTTSRYKLISMKDVQQTSATSSVEQVYSTSAINTILSTFNDVENIEMSTGIIQWTSPYISLDSSTTVNIGSLSGNVVDTTSVPGTLIDTVVYCSGATNVTPAFLTTQNNTYVLVNSAGVLTYQYTFPTGPERRTKIFLGGIAHPNRSTIQNAIISPDVQTSTMAQIRDYLRPIKLINDGVTTSNNGTNLAIKTSSGYIHALGYNYSVDVNNPSVVTISATTSATFQYKTQITSASFANTNSIVPGSYDLNGVVTTLPGNNNQSTNQYIFKSLNSGQPLRIQYGQTLYSSIANAIAGITSESFKFNSALADNLILIGILTVRKGATNLSLSSDAIFTKASKIGEVGIGGSGGTSTTTLNDAYLNSPTPEIVATNGAVSIQNGVADNTTNVLETNNYAGVTTFKVDGNGLTSATSFVEGGTTLSSKYVPQTRNIIAGTGLTGGGVLSADRTLSLSAVGTAGTYNTVVTNAYGQVTSGSTSLCLNSAYTKTFTSADVNSSILTLVHGLSSSYPTVTIFDNNSNQIIPYAINSLQTSAVTVNLSGYGNITGTWKASVIIAGNTSAGNTSVSQVNSTQGTMYIGTANSTNVQCGGNGATQWGYNGTIFLPEENTTVSLSSKFTTAFTSTLTGSAILACYKYVVGGPYTLMFSTGVFAVGATASYINQNVTNIIDGALRNDTYYYMVVFNNINAITTLGIASGSVITFKPFRNITQGNALGNLAAAPSTLTEQANESTLGHIYMRVIV
jgi:hypothetical protein